MNKINKNIHYITTGLMALISFFGLIFPLIKSQSMGLFTMSENGFQFIAFSSSLVASDVLMYLMGAFALLQLLAAVTAFVYFMITIYSKEKVNEKKLSFIFNIIYISILFVNMVLGIVAVILANDGVASFYTLGYIPFILGAFVFIFYFINQKMNGTSEEAKAKPANKTQKSKSEDGKTAA